MSRGLDMMRAVWPRTDLTSPEKAVLLALLQHADDRLQCFPSHARLCQYTSFKPRAVQYAIDALKARGFLTFDRHAGKNGTNRYQLFELPPEAAKATEAAAAEPEHLAPDARLHEVRDNLAPDARLHEVRDNLAPGANELPIELPTEPDPVGSARLARSADGSLFGSGVAFLIAHGTAERQARSVIGRWRKAHPDPVILDAMAAAERHEVTEPVAWISARLRGAPGLVVVPFATTNGVSGHGHPTHDQRRDGATYFPRGVGRSAGPASDFLNAAVRSGVLDGS